MSLPTATLARVLPHVLEQAATPNTLDSGTFPFRKLVASGMVRIRKVLGTLNPADILTKYIAKDRSDTPEVDRHVP